MGSIPHQGLDIEGRRFPEMENLLAKALYDNTAECPDELAFRKGDIVTVMEQNVAGSQGWWKCSLHGRQGLAPANRLHLLSPSLGMGLSPGTVAVGGCLTLGSEKPSLRSSSPMNIYQIPTVPRPSLSPAYEQMDQIYKVPSPLQHMSRVPSPSTRRQSYDGQERNSSPSKMPVAGKSGSPRMEVYDVPTLSRHASLMVSNHPPMNRKFSLIPTMELEERYEILESVKCSSLRLTNAPSYDTPTPLTSEAQEILGSRCSTLPNPRKTEWIYDVPITPDKPGREQGYYGTIPTMVAGTGRQLYDNLPARVWPGQGRCSMPSLYDIPKPSSTPRQASDNGNSVYDIPPRLKQPAPPTGAPGRGVATGLLYDHPRGQSVTGTEEPCNLPPVQDEEGEERDGLSSLSTADSQRSSTASSSSASSCDSLALSSSSLEPAREVTLSQEDAARRLAELQDEVCRAVPQLMAFVSSSWRSRKHLGQHLGEIRAAAEGINVALVHFLDFALDVRGNARRLTDANLKSRLHKQLSIVEDSGLILQHAMGVLSEAGWKLDTLSQDAGQAQTPDQLDRFVMVARTVPEDVRRLVSILNANGKLLFRQAQTDAETSTSGNQSKAIKNLTRERQMSDYVGEDNDYVQLQTKTEFEQSQRMVQESKRLNEVEVKKPSPPPPPQRAVDPRSPALSEHCRLYFGALQKAISVFTGSLLEGQPPEKFIDHSKLVIMVGQRLVDQLYREAHGAKPGQDMLCKGSHLCALLKKLAVTTKKAALHFPDRQALQEAQDFAKELAQRALHIRTTLDL